MTRLKIEVTADDDAAAVRVLCGLRCKMSLSPAILKNVYMYEHALGTATATVEREQGGSEPCDAI